MYKTSLKISISPRDLRLLHHILPHQLLFWHDSMDEILIVLDLHGYDSKEYKSDIQETHYIVQSLLDTFPKTRFIQVDYSKQAMDEISRAYFGGQRIPIKTHRYGPYYSYFYGLYNTKYDYVLNIDSDILFGGNGANWVKEAAYLLESDKSIITCSPLPGPPRQDGRLIRQEGKTDNSTLKKIYFKSISTRIFFIYKPSFQENICPITVKIAKWPLLSRALLRKRPIYELPEDTISDIMQKKALKRVDFLGTEQGVWTLHPPYRNEEFYRKLPEIVKRVENNDLPDEQRGDYDLNSSMVDWDDAKRLIENASIKKQIFKLLRLTT